MKIHQTSLLILALACLTSATARAREPQSTAPVAELESSTPAPATTGSPGWWESNCKRIDDDLKKMDGKVDLVFVGDSITARWRTQESWKTYWGGYRAVNMGIGGDCTQNVLWRLKNGDLDGYKAKLFVVMIGTNNMWGKNPDPAHATAGVKAVLDLIHEKQPQAKILLLSILPTGEKPNPGREKRMEVNKLISKFAGGHVEYMDIADKFLEPDGTISKEVMHDHLHLAPKGFEIWAEAIKDRVKETVKG